MKKVIIFGANGMAGHMISTVLKGKGTYKIIDVCHTKKLDHNSIILDVRVIKRVNSLIEQEQPNLLINCIGLLTEKAKKDPPAAIYINSFFPRYLEDYCKNIETKIIHLSTDCVFSGKEGQYTEDSVKDGKDIYGQTKSLGEIINRKDLTIRTSIIGPELKDDGVGLFHWLMKQQGEILGFSNVIWTGLTTLQLAQSLDRMIAANVTGLYQLVPSHSVTKYQLLNIIKQIFNKDIVIKKEDNPLSDKSLLNTRTDYQARIPDYQEMIVQLYQFMVQNERMYQRYLQQE